MNQTNMISNKNYTHQYCNIKNNSKHSSTTLAILINSNIWIKITLSIVALLMLNSCSFQYSKKKNTKVEVHIQKAEFHDLHTWHYDNHTAALLSFKKSCTQIMQKNPQQPISKSTQIGGTIAQWQQICKEAEKIHINQNKNQKITSKTNSIARKFFEKNFQLYRISDKYNDNVGKFTGYYAIEINGNTYPTKKYKHPVYQAPPNLTELKGKKDFKHSSINKGTLRKKGLEIAWVDNKARLFFMHIQGSGIIKLPNKKEIKLEYGGQNGFSYTAIGPYFKYYAQSKIESAKDMMDWLHKYPEKGKTLMEKNESYVFFKVSKSDEESIGGQGIQLTPERSIAIDYRIFPYGTPIWLETQLPKTKSYKKTDYHRLLIAQDSGGAIKGAVRGDIFFGRGNRAEELACYMNNLGIYYALFPKNVKIPSIYITQ